MESRNFDLDLYFERIGFGGNKPEVVDSEFLREIVRAQLFSVPFENLDVQMGKIVSMNPEDIFEKIVVDKRGGYCYEVNALFAMALNSLGVSYRFIAARPMFYPVRRPKTHMVIVAKIGDEEWLCDLGFGSYGIREPIRLTRAGIEVNQYPDIFRLSFGDEGEYLLEAFVDNEWKRQYSFDLSSWTWIDFIPANYLNSTHPDAVFVQKILVIQHHPDGRDILFGNTFKTIRGGKIHEKQVLDDEVDSLLQEKFKLPGTFRKYTA